MCKINCKKIIICAAVLFASFAGGTAFSATSGAERLTVLLPDDVAGFIAASGCDEMKPAFEKTILGQMWYDASTQNFYQSIKTELVNKIKQEISDANEAQIPEKILNFAQTLLKRPIIAGAAIDKSNEDFPFYGFAIVDTGTRKSEIAAMLAELEGLVEEDNIVDVDIAGLKLRGPSDTNDVQVYWGMVGNYLAFAVNDKNGLAIKYLKGSQNRITPNYLANVQGNGDALAMYVDIQKITEPIKSEAGKEGAPEELQKAQEVLDILGVSDIKAVKSRLGFSGPDLISDEIIELGVQHKGIFRFIRPINMGMLDMVDSRAVSTSVFNIETSGIYDTIMNAIQAVAPAESYMEMQDTIREAESEIGFNIRNELLASFSGPTAIYSMPAGVMTEAPTGGVILIAGLRNKQSFEKVMEAIGSYASANSDGMVQVISQVQDGRTVHTFAIMPLAMMQIMPTWTVIEDYVVVGTNGPLCSAAVKQITAQNRRASSIRETVGYKKATEGMPVDLVYLSYTDSKAQFNEMMRGAQQFWPMVTMLAANQGVKLPFMLPSLSHITEKMGPSCGYCWFDKDGLRSRYKGVGVEQSLGAVAGASVSAGVLMPALAKVRQQAQKTVSASNLKQIAMALLTYAHNNDDKYPPDLETLVKEMDLPPKTLICPHAPKNFPGEHYIYITGQKTVMPPDNVLVYENPQFCTEGVNVLFNDSHVEFMGKEKFVEALKKTYERLGKEMPEIKFDSYYGIDVSDEDYKVYELHEAICDGDLGLVKKLFDEDVDVNAVYDGYT